MLTSDAPPKKKKSRIREILTPEELACTQCRYQATTKTGLLNHVRKHLLIVEYYCALCQAKFDTNNALKEHKIEHKNDKLSFLCTKCEVAFTDHCEWLQHQYKHYGARSSYKCIECTQYFKQKSIVIQHVKTHFDFKVPCEVCGEILTNHNQVQDHKDLHSKIYECCECGSVLKNKKALDYHMISHTGLKVHQCLYCGKAYGNISAVNVHTRIHTNERPYKCTKCLKGFHQQTDFKKHACKVDGVDNRVKIKCEICQKKIYEASIKSHMRIHDDSARKLPCPECGERFITSAGLRAHLLYKHTTDKPFKCNEADCEAEFKMKTALNRHVRTRHKREFVE